jgi:hypothetical protein
MPVQVVITAHKPLFNPSVAWFKDVDAQHLADDQALGAWTLQQPGFISGIVEYPDAMTARYVMVWASQQAHDDWNTARLATPIGAARRAYNDSVGIWFSPREFTQV